MITAVKGYLAWINSEEITLELRDGAQKGGWTRLNVTKARRRAVDHRQSIFAGVAVQGNELVWNIPDEQLQSGGPGGRKIRVGDRITAGSETWVVIAVNLMTFSSRWRSLCRQELQTRPEFRND